MKLTPHFSLDELTVTNTGLNNSPSNVHLANLRVLALGLEQVRSIIGNHPMIVTSGYRSPRVNKRVGGVATSDHSLGYAADFRTPAMSCRRVCELLVDSFLIFDQLILERADQIIHISFNPRLRGQVLRQPGGPGSAFFQGLG